MARRRFSRRSGRKAFRRGRRAGSVRRNSIFHRRGGIRL